MNASLARRTLIVAALVACTAATAADPAPVTVEITRFAYSPKELTVAPGTMVRWVNKDQTPHTVTSVAPNKTLASKAMDTDDGFEFTFKEVGDFAYLCTMHPFMTGTVHVRR